MTSVTNEVRRQVQREWTVMDTMRQRKSLVLGMVEGKKRPGRPVRRWIDDILTSLVLGMVEDER